MAPKMRSVGRHWRKGGAGGRGRKKRVRMEKDILPEKIERHFSLSYFRQIRSGIGVALLLAWHWG